MKNKAGQERWQKIDEENRKRRENKMLNRYGLERIDEVDIDTANLKRFKPSIDKDIEKERNKLPALPET